MRQLFPISHVNNVKKIILYLIELTIIENSPIAYIDYKYISDIHIDTGLIKSGANTAVRGNLRRMILSHIEV